LQGSIKRYGDGVTSFAKLCPITNGGGSDEDDAIDLYVVAWFDSSSSDAEAKQLGY